MKIPQRPQLGTPNGPNTPATSLSAFKLETLRQQVEKNPLAALSALGAWRAETAFPVESAVRWPLDPMPLSVWLPAAPEATLPKPAVLFTTLRQWETASNGLIRFRLMDPHTESAPQAHIEFQWTPETTPGRDYEVGHAKREVQGSRIRRVTITLVQEPIIDGYLSATQRQSRLLATVLHEVGHALGLEHSESSQDVMFYRGWRREQLSPNDGRRLQALYQNTQSQA